jgi:hypothetical protein
MSPYGWTGNTACAPAASGVFSPLDEELGLLPGALTPRLQDHLTRLATYAPFGKAAGLLRHLLGVAVSEPTVRRVTERVGAALVTASTAEQRRLETEAPAPPPDPGRLLLSIDGAMVPLLKGQWAEVKTLVIGQVGEAQRDAAGKYHVPCTNLTYFSRLQSSEAFSEAAYPEIYRRGIESATAVVAVSDGAEWCQKFVDFHRPDAVRILDFPHAAQRIAAIGAVAFPDPEGAGAAWAQATARQLRDQGPQPVLAALAALVPPTPADAARLQEHREYLRRRRQLLRYPAFRRAGWPIGSGCVESANKLVVEARLKGAGMHWAPRHVDPMLALRNAECNGRWAEAWRLACHHLRAARRPLAAPPAVPPVPSTPAPASLGPAPTPANPASPSTTPSATPRPHPWRRFNPGYLGRRPAGIAKA